MGQMAEGVEAKRFVLCFHLLPVSERRILN